MRRWLPPLLLAALCLAAPRPARAVVFDALFDLMSRRAPQAPGSQALGKPREIVFNGLALHVTTGRSPKSVTEILDYYQERFQGGALKDLAGGPANLRREGERGGTLMSAEVPDRATAQLVAQGKRSLLSSGPLRVVYARRNGAQTDYMVATSDKPLPDSLFQLVQSADAPGEDVPGVPRPQGVRTFSFAEPKAGYRVVMYEVTSSASQALREVASRIGGAGWSEDALFAAAARKRNQLAVRFSQGRKDVVVTAQDPSGDQPTQLVYLSRDLPE